MTIFSHLHRNLCLGPIHPTLYTNISISGKSPIVKVFSCHICHFFILLYNINSIILFHFFMYTPRLPHDTHPELWGS